MIYFIQSGETGPIKIGYSYKSVKCRLSALQMGNHKKLHILKKQEGSPRDEKMMHERFNHLHIKGEWFKPDRELLDYIYDREDKVVIEVNVLWLLSKTKTRISC